MGSNVQTVSPLVDCLTRVSESALQLCTWRASATACSSARACGSMAAASARASRNPTASKPATSAAKAPKRSMFESRTWRQHACIVMQCDMQECPLYTRQSNSLHKPLSGLSCILSSTAQLYCDFPVRLATVAAPPLGRSGSPDPSARAAPASPGHDPQACILRNLRSVGLAYRW